MKRFFRLLAGLALCGGFAPQAFAAQNIGCIDTGYSSEENADLEAFYRSFRFDIANRTQFPPALIGVLSRRASECADTHGWQPEAIEQAIFYRLASIFKVSLERVSPLSATQRQRLDAVLAAADQERLQRVVGGMMDAVIDGRGTGPEPSDADKLYFGRLMLRAGVPLTEANAQYVGAYLGAAVMIDRTRARFEAQ